MHKEIHSWIAGHPRPSASSERVASLNPALPSEVVAMSPRGDAVDVDAAVAASIEAQHAWAKKTGAARAESLYAWAGAILERQEEMAQALAREIGKPLGEARGEVGRCVGLLRYYAGEAVHPNGDVVPALVEGALQFTLEEPIGVVGMITPWNFPLAIPLWKAAPALAYGNSVILKPSELSPYCGDLLAQTAAKANLPSGLFQVVQGVGETAGRRLVAHPDVAAISFTGSQQVGLAIGVACAARNARYQAEMGGKNIAIVLPDANLKQAANLIAAGAMRFAGQKCTATSRVAVVRSVRDEFLKELTAAIEALHYGDPMEPANAVGPVISAESHERLLCAIDEIEFPCAYRQAEVSDALKVGYFVPPVVFTDVPSDSDLAQDELFGPVLSVIDADSLDHALEIANGIRFGLSASLFTANLQAALSYVRKIEVGMVRVNADTTGVDLHAPFGGMKGSSSHSREQGTAARDFYTEIRTVQINP